MQLIINRCKNIKGEIKVPADKSITHRAMIFGAISKGKTIIQNYSKGKDCMTTFNILRNSGIKIEKTDSDIIVNGEGFSGFRQSSEILNCENSGTTFRLMSGVFSSLNFKFVLTGDSSLRKRPMDRIINPLKKMGADIIGTGSKGLPPVIIRGKNLKPYHHQLKISSAQVKSALILASLNTNGETIIEEPIQSRDHTERMLGLFGADISVDGNRIKVKGKLPLFGTKLYVLGDISSASYFIALALLVENSEILIKEVGINKTRTGFLDILKKMGANFKIENIRIISNEPVADIIISGKQKLEGVIVEREDIPGIIDELPLLAVVATQAKGETIVRGAEELRIKESDRISTITKELKKLGGKIEETKDGFIVEGETVLKGSSCDSHGDHRIAMSLTIAGLIAEGETIVNNSDCIDISFPEFKNYFKELNCERIIGV
jgi:3-phosphoshikimate 1-carboxyvinyltransferase